MSLLILGTYIIAIMAVWHFMVKKTLLDATRDKLFDLRDELREVYLAEGWDLGSDAYGNLRKMLNDYLTYAEHYSVWSVLYLHRKLTRPRNAALLKHLVSRTDSRFKVSNEKEAAYIATIRGRAVAALMAHSVYSSGTLMILAIIATPFVLIGAIVDSYVKGMSVLGGAVAKNLWHLDKLLGVIWQRSVAWIGNQTVDQQSIDVAASSDSEQRLAF